MGGEISLESELGKGSTFRFTAQFEKQPGRSQFPEVSEIDLADERILIVGGTESSRLQLSLMLDSWYCVHDGAPDEETALKLLNDAVEANAPYHIVIVDTFMSSKEGEAFGNNIKTSPTLKNTLLVMMTSLGRQGDVARLRKAGFAAYLTKPVRKSQLYNCIISVLDRRKRPEEYPETEVVTRHSLKEEKRRRSRILLVEDNPTNQMVAMTMLGKLGYQTYAVNNGVEALTALEADSYDLVLMDCRMPEMDGYEATREIRKREVQQSTGDKIPRIPIIALTSHAMVGDRERCLASGMDDYITKPVNPGDISDMIEKWLNLQGEREAEEPVIKDTGPDAPVFNYSALMERLFEDEELVKEVTDTFKEDIAQLIESLESAVAEGDMELAERHAHTIKGAAGNVCAFALQETAYEMEKAAEAKQQDVLNALMPKLLEKLELLHKAMDAK
jgi:CheY-like chemotaxis protein